MHLLTLVESLDSLFRLPKELLDGYLYCRPIHLLADLLVQQLHCRALD